MLRSDGVKDVRKEINLNKLLLEATIGQNGLYMNTIIRFMLEEKYDFYDDTVFAIVNCKDAIPNKLAYIPSETLYNILVTKYRT